MNTAGFKAFKDRRSQRMASIGIALEDEVSKILLDMREKSLIADFKSHKHNSNEDMEGKDFTVTKIINNSEVIRSFGVTISIRCWHRSKMRHNEIPQFCFPIGTKPETMQKRILELFKII